MKNNSLQYKNIFAPPINSVPIKTMDFRAYYRKNFLPKIYFGYLHMSFSFFILTFSTIFPLFYIKNPSALMFLWIPAMLIVGNFFVYFFHRYPLHKKMRFFSYAYNVHTLRHHQFYTHEATFPKSHKDFHMIFFPAIVVAGFSFIGLPLIYALFYLFLGQNSALIITSMSAFYFLLYELMHFLYHLKEDHYFYKWKPLFYLKEHHRIHHDPQYMNQKNFNIVFPFFDYIFKTKL